jgi:Ca2+-binding RTX toxin-like protein
MMATINGTTSTDFILGTNEGDLIIAGSADDVSYNGFGDAILAGTGDDTIYCGIFSDYVSAGNGNDTVAAGNGDNWVDGGAGNDFITAGDGNDTLKGGSGNDTLYAGTGKNLLEGGTGDDTIWLTGGHNTVYFGNYAEVGKGGFGNDVMAGYQDGDMLYFESGIVGSTVASVSSLAALKDLVAAHPEAVTATTFGTDDYNLKLTFATGDSLTIYGAGHDYIMAGLAS